MTLTQYTTQTSTSCPDTHRLLLEGQPGQQAQRVLRAEPLDQAGVDTNLSSEVHQWKWPPSCHLETDRTQLEVSPLRRRGLGGQGRSVVTALLPDLKRKKNLILKLFPSWCPPPSRLTDPFPNPSQLVLGIPGTAVTHRSAGNSDGWQGQKNRGTQRWGSCGPAELPVAFDLGFLTSRVVLMGSSSCIPAT